MSSCSVLDYKCKCKCKCIWSFNCVDLSKATKTKGFGWLSKQSIVSPLVKILHSVQNQLASLSITENQNPQQQASQFPKLWLSCFNVGSSFISFYATDFPAMAISWLYYWQRTSSVSVRKPAAFRDHTTKHPEVSQCISTAKLWLLLLQWQLIQSLHASAESTLNLKVELLQTTRQHMLLLLLMFTGGW